MAMICLIDFQAYANPQLNRPPGAKNPNKNVKKDTSVSKKQGTAWILTSPLGLHKASTIDTLRYNYQKNFVPSMRSDAWTTTGVFGGAGINSIFMKRAGATTFFFDDAITPWIPTMDKVKFYNVYTPMTLLSYNYGGNKQNHQDWLAAQFAGNVNRNIGVGAFINYLYSKGCYEAQAVKNFNFGFNAYYTGNRYEMQTFYYHFNSVNKENGGITDDLYITDPAEVQGGITKVEPKSIPVNLTAAHNRISGDRLFTTQAFKVGYWETEQVNDTLQREVYIPLMRFVYSLDYEGRHHMFKNTNASQGEKFWTHRYLNPSQTDDNTRYWSVTNTIGVELMENFKKWAKFGITAFASIQTRRITQTTYYEQPELSDEDESLLTPIPENIEIIPRITQNRISAGGSISKQQGSILRYSANAKFGLTGGIKGDVSLYGDVSTRFRMLGDTVDINAHGGFYNLTNSYFLSNYISNHFVWNKPIGKTRTVKVGGTLSIPWTNTVISADLQNIQNYVFFNKESIPEQYGGNVQVFSISLEQKLRFGIWNWNNSIVYQTSSSQSVIPLPTLAIYSNMFLNFRAFRVLDIQFGVDCDYYTRFHALEYQPATMTFHVQDRTCVGNYPFCNLYLNCKLYKARFYLMMSHINQGWFGSNYFSMPHYPLNPRTFQIGLSVDLPD